jgi:hypothetical protein
VDLRRMSRLCHGTVYIKSDYPKVEFVLGFFPRSKGAGE